MGRRRRRAAGPGRAGDGGAVPGDLRAGWRLRSDDGRAAGLGVAAGDGAGDRGAQVGGRAGRDRPGRGHAPDHGRRTGRHAGVSGGGDPVTGRPSWTAADAHGHQRNSLRSDTSRHVPGWGPFAARSRAGRQPGRDAGRTGRLEGGRHDAVAGAPPRRHDRGPGDRRPRGGRTRLRHRPGSWPVGPAGPLADRRDSRRGAGDPLQAGGGDQRGGRGPGLLELPGPQHRGPGHPGGQAAHPGRRADAPLAPGAGRGRLDRARAGRLGRAGRPGSRPRAGAVGAGDHPADGRGALRRGSPVGGQGVHRRRRGRHRRSGALRPGRSGTSTGWCSGSSRSPTASRCWV